MGKALEDRLICKILAVVTLIFMAPFYLAFVLSAASLGLLPLGLLACLSDHPGLLSSPAARPYLKIVGLWTLVTAVLAMIVVVVSENSGSEEESKETMLMPTITDEASVPMRRLRYLADQIIAGDHSRGDEFDHLYSRYGSRKYDPIFPLGEVS